jgi:hypothetical protein
MSDSQNFGLGELGQRVQALADPAPKPRLQPYQGSSSAGTAANGRPSPAPENREQPRITSTPLPGSVSGSPQNSTPVPPYTPVAQPTTPSPAGFPPFGARAASPTPSQAPSATYIPQQPPAAPVNLLSAPPIDPNTPNAPKSGLQRAIDAVRSTIPLVQRLLPLLDGNFATAIGALVAPHVGHQQPPAPQIQPVHVDLEPVERGLAEVRTANRELRGQIADQGVSLKRVEDQLERVREATDRNTLEQQELVEDLRAVGSRVGVFAIIGVALLVISLGLNIYLLVQLQHILR